MPYNPGSAYPRQTTWTPHSHPNGLGIKPAVNAPKIGVAPEGRAIQFAGVGSAFARNQKQAVQRLNSGISGPTAAIMNQRGFVDQIQGMQREAAGRRAGQARRSVQSPGNPMATETQDQAESVVEKMAASVIESPQNGTATASPSLIIPPTRRTRTR